MEEKGVMMSCFNKAVSTVKAAGLAQGWMTRMFGFFHYPIGNSCGHWAFDRCLLSGQVDFEPE